MQSDDRSNLLLASLGSEGPGGESIARNVERILNAVRTHLQMDVAFVSEFGQRDRVFRYVVGKGERIMFRPGDSMPLDDGYCQRVVQGRIPQLIPDTSAVPSLASIPDTAAVPIGSHISVPITLRDGRTYGTFCCFSFRPNLTLDSRDLQMMRAFADLLAYQIDGDLAALSEHNAKVERVTAVLEMGQPTMVYQPICRLDDPQVVGVECLSRFDLEPKRPPDQWFAEAAEIGLGIRLELNAILTALSELQDVAGDFYVSLNVSPATIISGDILGYLDGIDYRRIVLEVTEHSLVEDYALLQEYLLPLRAQGIRIAVDDAGAGYASMRHVLAIQPEIIKLDMSLTRGIDSDSPRRALASALIRFAHDIGSLVIAEGVETQAESRALRGLGVDDAQGYFLSRPLPLEALKQLLEEGKR